MDIINFLRNLWHQPFFGSLLAIGTCCCYYALKKVNASQKKIIWIAYTLIFIIALVVFFNKVIERIYHTEVYDFMAFYLYGKVAAAGLDFYKPEDVQLVFHSLQIPALDYKIFTEEIVNIGAMYPPPTMLLFAPLGFLPYYTAEISWIIFLLLFVPGCIYLIYDLFFKADKLNGFVLVATLFLLLTHVRTTMVLLQTNFILLFLLLLMKKYQEKPVAGILLAIAFCIKPYMIVFGLVFLFKKQWKTLAYTFATSVVIAGFTGLFFGKGPFMTYLFNNPSKRLPEWIFSEDMNQSLHAVLLRSGIITMDKHLLYYLIVAGLLLLTVLFLFYLWNRKMVDPIWVGLLLIGLLLYPGTLSNYAVLLLFIIFQFFNGKKQLGFNKILTIVLIGLFYWISAISVFSCMCGLLLLIVLKSFFSGATKLEYL